MAAKSNRSAHMAAQILPLLRRRRDELIAVDSPRANWARITEWHARTRPLIAQYFKDQLEPFDKLIAIHWATYPRVISLSGRSDTSRVEAAERSANENIAANAKEKLVAHMDALIELLELDDAATNANSDHTSHSIGHGVFLVHGRNERWLQETARFVERFGLQTVILREQPNQGRTLIEKFEDVAQDIGFAIVLLTGDDRGGLHDNDLSTYSPRARQNVILELGFFLGRLRRSRVCALYEDGVEIPSDYSGVLFVKIDESGGWRLLLAREMKAAGLPIDMNNAF